MSRGKGKCDVTGKVRYPDHTAAVRALHSMSKNPRSRVPVRSYHCDACNGWHVTAQPEPGVEPT